MDEATGLFEDLMAGKLSVEEASNKTVFDKMKQRLQAYKRLLLHFLAAVLMIAILRNSIRAERTGNFCLHLQIVRDMLPYFAAAGHNYYTKAARLFL